MYCLCSTMSKASGGLAQKLGTVWYSRGRPGISLYGVYVASLCFFTGCWALCSWTCHRATQGFKNKLNKRKEMEAAGFL